MASAETITVRAITPYRRSEIVLAGAMAHLSGLMSAPKMEIESMNNLVRYSLACGRVLADAFAKEFEVEDDRKAEKALGEDT